MPLGVLFIMKTLEDEWYVVITAYKHWESTESESHQKAKMFFFLFQVATALLVAGSTLAFWIPPFASTSSYSSVVQSARLLV